MRVVQVSPTFFDDTSVIGGAERYTWELAKAMARQAEVTLVTFGPRPHREMRDGVAINVLRRMPVIDHPLASNPLSAGFLNAIRQADVVHCHQVATLSTSAGVLFGRMFGKPVFVTDLGGGHTYAPSNYVPVMRLASGFLLISEYSRSLWAAAPRARRPDSLEVIYGGVDTTRFRPGAAKDSSMVLYAGRLLPHKGIEHLIDAIEPPFRLHIVGREYDAAYAAMLRERARGKAVIFEDSVDDEGLIERYQKAFVSVLPSVSTNWRGETTEVSELFGLVVIEAMACGTPVIVSRTTSLPELVDDGRTGWIVPPGDARAITEKLRALHAQPAMAASMGEAARQLVTERFTWQATADRCLASYRRALGHATGAAHV
jgi:glycosyltransferase involved in cell wall biosynthesis